MTRVFGGGMYYYAAYITKKYIFNIITVQYRI